MRLNFHDKESIQFIRHTIAANCSTHYTISQLATIAGFNETKLKAGFKKLYGITLYQYSIQQRMQLAKNLIEEDQKTLAQISAATGYKHLANFITAFKKHHGHTPGQLKPR